MTYSPKKVGKAKWQPNKAVKDKWQDSPVKVKLSQIHVHSLVNNGPVWQRYESAATESCVANNFLFFYFSQWTVQCIRSWLGVLALTGLYLDQGPIGRHFSSGPVRGRRRRWRWRRRRRRWRCGHLDRWWKVAVFLPKVALTSNDTRTNGLLL